MRRWWISRAAHDEIVALYKERLSAADAAREAAETRHDVAFNDLLSRYQSLVERMGKAQGVPASTETPEAPVDFVLQAAHERWGNDLNALPFVSRFISEQRAKMAKGAPDAMSETQLLEMVMNGVSESDGVPL